LVWHFLAEYSKTGLSPSSSPGYDILAGCRRSCCASLCNGPIVATRCSLSVYTAPQGQWPWAILMLPTVIKTHRRRVSGWLAQSAQHGAIGWDASSLVTDHAHHPSQRLHNRLPPCGLGIARAAGEQHLLISSPHCFFQPLSGLKGLTRSPRWSVLIYNFADQCIRCPERNSPAAARSCWWFLILDQPLLAACACCNMCSPPNLSVI